MSLHPSVLIWTVICFCLFMLVINKLLFKPVLKLMDERGAKIKAAKVKAEEAEAKLAELEAGIQAERLAAENQMKMQYSRLIEAKRSEAESELAKLTAQVEGQKSAEAAELSRLSAETDAKLEAAADLMAEAFANRLIAGGKR